MGVALLAWVLATPFALPLVAAIGAGPLAALAGGLAVLRARPVEALLGVVASYVLTQLLAVPGLLVYGSAHSAGDAGGGALRVLGLVLLVVGLGVGRAYGKLYALAIVRHERLGAGTFA
jgi:hypothetical protein